MDTINQLQHTVIHTALIVGIFLTLRSFIAFFSGGNYLTMDRVIANVFALSLYLQLGFITYIFLHGSFNYEASLKAIEHAALTLFATILTIGGKVIASSSNDAVVKFRFRGIFFGLATGLLIYACIITVCLTI